MVIVESATALVRPANNNRVSRVVLTERIVSQRTSYAYAKVDIPPRIGRCVQTRQGQGESAHRLARKEAGPRESLILKWGGIAMLERAKQSRDHRSNNYGSLNGPI